MTQRWWRALSVLLVSALLIGKLMPAAWKSSVISLWDTALDVSLTAHILSFAAVTLVLSKAFEAAAP